jgi:ParB family chromosome partitioning protein
MSRKNLFHIQDSEEMPDSSGASPLSQSRPLAGLDKPAKRSGAVGAISQSLNGINDKALRTEELERTLASGQTIVELDPNSIDSSIVTDRLGMSLDELDVLEQQIRQDGQLVPILVRPHPDQEGRFQAAYGHRRLIVIKRIGIPVRAIVRRLTDSELVVSQGQENSSRQDLTFIERAVFAVRLENRGFDRGLITSALSIDKANLSRMIALVHQFPLELIEAVGSAPSYGRIRWAEVAELLQETGNKAKALRIVQQREFGERTSDARFEAIYEALRPERESARAAVWSNGSSAKAVKIFETRDKLSLSFDKSIEPAFGLFVEERLTVLYEEYLRLNKESQKAGD